MPVLCILAVSRSLRSRWPTQLRREVTHQSMIQLETIQRSRGQWPSIMALVVPRLLHPRQPLWKFNVWLRETSRQKLTERSKELRQAAPLKAPTIRRMVQVSTSLSPSKAPWTVSPLRLALPSQAAPASSPSEDIHKCNCAYFRMQIIHSKIAQQYTHCSSNNSLMID